MKRIVLLMAMLLLGVVANAASYKVYCTLMAFNFWGFGKVKIEVDMGNAVRGTSNFEYLYGENGKLLKFNTPMGGVNYMAKRGWKMIGTYYVTRGTSNVVHYVMEKEVENEEQIYEGLILKAKKESDYDPKKDAFLN